MRSSREEQSYAHGGEYHSSGSSSGSTVAGRVLIIVIVCAFIYFISAGAAGKWIAQNIVTPVISIFDQGDAAATNIVGTVPSANASASANAAGQTSQKILLPDMSLYCLQIGAFNDQKNADDSATEARARGGAGYILTDGTKRVLLSGYKNEADEKSVAGNLTQTSGYQTYEYILSAKGVTFNITAQQNNIDAIKNFFTEAQTVHDAYYDLSVALDSQKSTAQEITDKISALKQQTDPMVLSIDNMAQGSDNVLKNMKTYADGLQQVLSTDLSGKSDVEISSQLKYNYIWISDLYKKFVAQIQ
jgi:hypothetical protein